MWGHGVGLAGAMLLLIGLHRLSLPARAGQGLRFVGAGMLLSLGATALALKPGWDWWPAAVAVVGGLLLGYLTSGRDRDSFAYRIAWFNGLGSLAAASLSMVSLLRAEQHETLERSIAVVAVLFGMLAMAGSFTAAARLADAGPRIDRTRPRQGVYVAAVVLVALLGLILASSSTAHPVLLVLFVLVATAAGASIARPIEPRDLPVLVSCFNVLTGLAVALDGLLLASRTMIVAGAFVFAAGALLTRLMARAANRRLSDILYSGFGLQQDRLGDSQGSRVHRVSVYDAAVQLGYARRVLLVPGYGMALAQAHHKLRELTQLLDERGVETAYAIHPVAGRLPGHMDLLLADAGVPDHRLLDLEAANAALEQHDVVLVIGASDIVNPVSQRDPQSALFDMSVIEAVRARRVIVIESAMGVGYSGERNLLLDEPVTRVLRGDAREVLQALIHEIKSLV